MDYIYRKFHSSLDGKDYLLRKNDGKYKSATLFQINVKDGIKEEVPVLSKVYNGLDEISRTNILTGAESRVRNVNGYKLYSELYDMAGKLGIKFDTAPNNKIFKLININDAGTNLNLLVRDGEIKSVLKNGFCVGSNTLEKISPFAKKWVKKFLQMMFKAL